MAQGTTRGVPIDTDNTLAADSDILVPSQKAIKAYITNLTFNATKIADGSVSNTEFQYLDGVTSSIQTQLNGKEPTITSGTSSQYYRGDKTFQTLNSTAVGLGNVPNLDTSNPANITQSSSFRFVTDTEKSTWNGKQNALTNPVTGTGTNNEIAAFNSTGSTITSLSTTTYPSLTELSYVKGLTSAIQTQINALPRVVYTDYDAETTTSTSTTNTLTTFSLTISDANWPLGGLLRLSGLMERTAGTGSVLMGVVVNGSTARYVSSNGQNTQWEWTIIKEAANTLRIGMGPSNTTSGSYTAHNQSTVTATASAGNYVFTFYMFVGTAGATGSMRWMKGIMIP